MAYPARSPLPGEEESARPKTATAPAEGAEADLKRLTVRLPADIVDGLTSAAHGEGTSRGLLVRRLLETALRKPPADPAVVLPGTDGRPTLVHDEGLREAPDGDPIPDGYTGLPAARPAGGKPAVSPDPPDADPPDDPDKAGTPGAGEARSEPAAVSEEPASAPPVVPGSVLFQAPPPAHAGGKVFRCALVAVLLLAGLGLVLGAAAQRYQLHAPNPGAYGAGAYLVDRWSGRVWFCDSAQRGLPARVCAPFSLGRLVPPAPAAP